jgi:taurine-pyruvate aminotransferase
MEPKQLKQVLEMDLQNVWHPLTQHKALATQPPKVMVRAQGSTIVDAEGREYLDAMAGLWCVNVGYGRREIADAVYRQMQELAYYPHLQANVPAAQLADRLTALTGGEPRHTYFVNSGTEANETAFKLARQYHRQVHPAQGRYKFISRYFSYHGTSFATLSAGALPERKMKYEPLGDGFIHVPPAYCYRCPFGLSYPGCGLACAKQIEYAIKAEGAESVAAVVIEPIQSALGILVPPDEYLPEVAAACRRHGVLLILDEVINGFGRTGKWFAYQHYGVTPDLLCIAKGITSGYQPLAGVMATSEVFDGFLGELEENRQIAGINTWGGHAAACAAALVNVDIMARENLPARATETGAYLLERLRGLLSLPVVGDVRGKGLLLGVELVEDKAERTPFGTARMLKVIRSCLDRGVIVGRSAGAGAGLGNCITLSPPLVLTRGEADRIVETLGEVLRATV